MTLGRDGRRDVELLRCVAARAVVNSAPRERLVNVPNFVLREASRVSRHHVDVVIHKNAVDSVHLVFPADLEGGPTC